MKTYRKQIRPMFVGPMLMGFSQDYYPFYGEEVWFNEEEVTEADKFKWEKEIKNHDSWGSMEIEERFIEYEE